jgi:anaerobic magnesium-protoporphyrin IX monomethyl ester cyclase
MLTKKKRLDLLLVNPGGRTQVYQSLASELAAVEPPIWAGLMATFIRKRGFSVRILDTDAESLTPEEAVDRIAEMTPILAAVVVFGHNPSASTQVMPSAGEICTGIKQQMPDLKVLLVGGHVAALPERTLLEEKADFVCGGEGPYTILELLQALKSGAPDYRKVHGLWYRDGQGVVSTAPAPLVMNLDREMPGIAWDLLPMEKYRAHNWHCFGDLRRQPYAALYTTVGCPYHCTFCCIQAPFRSGEEILGYKKGVNSYRLWSPQSVIAEIDILVNRYGVRNIKIADELFVLKPRHVETLCDLLIERRYDLNIWAYARVDTVNKQLLDKLKRANFNWLGFGIESASERVLTDASKGYKQEGILQALEKVSVAGINIGANYIFGLPEDDLKSMQSTLDLALELNAEWANFYAAMAYPGSQLYHTALRERWPLPQRWSGYSQHAVDTLPLPTRYLSGSEVLRFRDQAFQAYFHSPSYLESISQKFGPETAIHILDMASHRLDRQHDKISFRRLGGGQTGEGLPSGENSSYEIPMK